ncbi:hypothetical protein BU15DRAFT_67622 [Melanogaster broomeanus]|nr:hypothetical protein BU15DRAFT_67622 [Melanogaster broomeanus]
MTTQRSHTSDDATQPRNAPHGRYGLDSAIVTTQRSQPSDDATQPTIRRCNTAAQCTSTEPQQLIDECGPISGIKLCLRPIHIIYAIYATTMCSHDDNDSPACSAVICPCTTCTQPPVTATATTTAQCAPNAGMMSMVPSGHNDDDSLTCIQHASHSLMSVVPSWVSSSVVCPCTTCMQPPRATMTTTARHSPNVPQHVQQQAAV